MAVVFCGRPLESITAEIVADMMVTVGEQTSRDRHWNEEALSFLTGLVLHIKTTAPRELQNLPYVRKLVMLPRGTPEEPGEFEQMLGRGPHLPLSSS